VSGPDDGLFDPVPLEAAESRRDWEFLVQSLPHIVWTAKPDGGLTFCNQHGLEFMGGTLDTIVGRSWEQFIHPDDLPRVLEKWTAAVRQQGLFQNEQRIRRGGDGAWEWFLVLARPQVSSSGEVERWVGVSTSIESIKRHEAELRDARDAARAAEAALAEKEAALRDIAETVPGMLYEFERAADGSARFTYVSSGARRAWGVEPDDALADVETILDRVHPEDAKRVFAAMDASANEQALFDVEHRLAGPEPTRWVSSRSIPRRTSRGTVKWTGVSVDITDRKLAEREQEQLERALQQSRRFESLGLLSQGIAHDFNNLLMTIVGNLSLAMEMAPPDLLLYLESADRASQRARELCSQLMDYASQKEPGSEEVELGALAAEMIEIVQPNLSTEVRFASPPQPCIVTGDPTQLRQVVSNLVINAGQAVEGSRGGVQVRVGTADRSDAPFDYEVGPEIRGPHVFLEVEDEGVGMEPDALPRIFEPFYTTKPSGHGLGLAAVLGAVKRHQGALQVRSRPNVGTTMRVLLPERSRADGSAPEERKWSGRVLFVDDEPELRRLGRAMLERLGFEVDAIGSGGEALDRLEDPSYRSSLAFVMLDIVMPGVDGAEVVRRIRALDPKLKFLMVSGYLSAEGAHTDSADVEFLQKPYSLSGLDARVAALLGS
jgi:PAS domain S-box-containing protein